MDLAQTPELTRHVFTIWAAEKREAYRLSRHEWASSVGRPYPKRRKKDQRPAPGALDLAASEEG